MNDLLSSRLDAIRQALMAHHQGGRGLPNDTIGEERQFLIDRYLREVLPPLYRFGSGVVVDPQGTSTGASGCRDGIALRAQLSHARRWKPTAVLSRIGGFSVGGEIGFVQAVGPSQSNDQPSQGPTAEPAHNCLQDSAVVPGPNPEDRCRPSSSLLRRLVHRPQDRAGPCGFTCRHRSTITT